MGTYKNPNPISISEIKDIIKILSTKKSPGTDRFIAEFYKKFSEDLILFNETERETVLPNSFLEANITLIPK